MIDISIITPTYNRAHLLPRMINSVLAQTYDNWELIIVDDGSTDNTKEVVESFNDERIKYYFKENSGAADSRNIGVDYSTSDYIIFLDSDDEAKSNWLEDMFNLINEYQTDVVCCGLEKHDFNGEYIGERLPEDLGSIFNNVIANFLSGTILMHKKYFIETSGYDIILSSGQHTELLMRLLPLFERDKVDIKNIFKPLVIIHIHKGERIRHNFDAIYRGSTRTLKKHKILFDKNVDKHYDYLSVAARCAFKTNRIKEGKELTLRALKLKPFKALAIGRFLVAYIPFIRKKFFSNN